MDFIEKLDKWVGENPEAADAPTINIKTGKEFTIRGILAELKRAKNEGIEILDEDIVAVQVQNEEWIGGV